MSASIYASDATVFTDASCAKSVAALEVHRNAYPGQRVAEGNVSGCACTNAHNACDRKASAEQVSVKIMAITSSRVHWSPLPGRFGW